MTRNAILTLLILLVSCFSFSHQKEIHKAGEGKKENQKKSQIEAINRSYIKDIKPIFQNKCFDCHATAKSLPWYFVIPGPKHLMRDDMEEAKEHLDMREDFPFKGHGTPAQDLNAIKKIIEDDSMPPLRYKMLHWRSGLDKDEKNLITDWVEQSLKSIGGKKTESKHSE